MQLLADKLIELEVVESTAEGTVWRTLKKPAATVAEKTVGLGKVAADLLWRMEPLLDLSAAPYAPQQPLHTPKPGT